MLILLILDKRLKISLIKLLQKNLPKYKYYSFIKYQILLWDLEYYQNRLKIQKLRCKIWNKTFRPILETTTFIYENTEFKVFNNHWPSKAVGESYRIKYAKTLQDRLVELEKRLWLYSNWRF